MWLVYLALLVWRRVFPQSSRHFATGVIAASHSCSSPFGAPTCSRPSIIHENEVASDM